MVIMDLWGMAYHPVVVIAPIYILLFNSISTCCASSSVNLQFQRQMVVAQVAPRQTPLHCLAVLLSPIMRKKLAHLGPPKAKKLSPRP